MNTLFLLSFKLLRPLSRDEGGERLENFLKPFQIFFIKLTSTTNSDLQFLRSLALDTKNNTNEKYLFLFLLCYSTEPTERSTTRRSSKTATKQRPPPQTASGNRPTTSSTPAASSTRSSKLLGKNVGWFPDCKGCLLAVCA